MAHTLKRTARFCLRTLLTVALFMLGIAALVQLSLFGAVAYLNAGKARDSIQSYVDEALAASGYTASFDSIAYDPVRGLMVRSITLSDAQGQFMSLDRVALSVDFSKIPLHHLDLSLKAGTLTLLRVPQAGITEPSTPLESFPLPDLYFTTARISSLEIQNLILDEKVLGTRLSFSPVLEASIDLRKGIEFDADLLPQAAAPIYGVALPEKVHVAGLFDPLTLALQIDDLAITSPEYTVSAKGQLVEDNALTINLEAAYPDLKSLTQGQLESAILSLHVSGTTKKPTITADGTVKTAELKERGLADIVLKITSEDALQSQKANVSIQTLYQEHPVELIAAVTYMPELIKLESIAATAPQIEITGAATLSTQTFLPEGTFHVSASDLSYYQSLMAIDLAGALTADITLTPEAETIAADIKATLNSARYDTMRVSRIDATTHFPDIASPWPQLIDAQISGLVLSDDLFLQNTDIKLSQKEDGIYGLALNGSGTASVPFSFKGAADLSNLSGAFPTVKEINLSANFNKSSVVLTGEASPDSLDIKLNTKGFAGNDIPVSLPEASKDIRVSGDVTVTGTPASPITSAKITADGFDTGTYKNLLITADAHHESGKATIALTGQGSGIKTLKANVSLPLTFSLLPFSFEAGAQSIIVGDFQSEFQLATLAPLFLPPTQSLSGTLQANGKIAGTIGAPDINGNVSFKNGAFTAEEQGVELAKMNAEAQFTNSRLTLRSLTATDNELGVLNAKGELSLGSGSAGKISLSMKNFHLPKSEMANGHLDAALSLESAASGLSAKGTIDIAEMNITIPETFMSNIPELNIIKSKKGAAAAPPMLATSLAIKVNAPNQIFVRGWGLDAEFGGTVDITGDAASPQFNGTLSSKRGRFEEFGKRFTLAHADLRFQGEVPPSPYLDIEATTPSDDITASVLLTGPVQKPVISFSSNPALPQDEVLSRILFNKDSSKITPFQAIQLAQMIQRFSGKGGGSSFDPLGTLRAATSLDDISVDTDASGQTNVGVGKYLTDKVYLEVEKGKAANSGNATIQIEVTPQINIQSEIGQDSQTGGGIFWKRDY